MLYLLFAWSAGSRLHSTSPRRCTREPRVRGYTLSTFQTCVTQPFVRRDEPDSHNWPLNTVHFYPSRRTCNPADRIEFLRTPSARARARQRVRAWWLKPPPSWFVNHRNTKLMRFSWKGEWYGDMEHDLTIFLACPPLLQLRGFEDWSEFYRVGNCRWKSCRGENTIAAITINIIVTKWPSVWISFEIMQKSDLILNKDLIWRF